MVNDKIPRDFHSFEKFDDSNPFEPIILEGTLNIDSAKEFEAGKRTSTVTYNTRYTGSNGEPVRITFGIGATISVNAIIGLPILTA